MEEGNNDDNNLGNGNFKLDSIKALQLSSHDIVKIVALCNTSIDKAFKH